MAVFLEELVVKILPDVELAWRGNKPAMMLMMIVLTRFGLRSALSLVLVSVVSFSTFVLGN